MTISELTIQKFLSNHKLSTARREPIKSDASFRTYDRLTLSSKSYILMKAPPDKENIRPFMAIANFLRRNEFSAPQIIASDSEAGLMLLEDFGNDLFSVLLKSLPNTVMELYETAIDLLLHLHELPLPNDLTVDDQKSHVLKSYNSFLLDQELALFSDWYLPTVGVKDTKSLKEEIREMFKPLFRQILQASSVLTLRDYHAENLIWLPKRTGIKRVGLLDFQDAVLGHRAYDLVSLLQDARRPYDKELEENLLYRYLSHSRLNQKEFLVGYHTLGIQRNLKIIGIFTRLWQRDGKKKYLQRIPHVWSLLETNLVCPLLADIGAKLKQIVPLEKRSQLPI